MGKTLCAHGGRTKKLTRSPQFLTQFNVATSLGYKMFKTESIDEMPFEQYRALVAVLNNINKEAMKDIPENTTASRSDDAVSKRTTFRVVNEISKK